MLRIFIHSIFITSEQYKLVRFVHLNLSTVAPVSPQLFIS